MPAITNSMATAVTAAGAHLRSSTPASAGTKTAAMPDADMSAPSASLSMCSCCLSGAESTERMDEHHAVARSRMQAASSTIH